MAHIEELPQSAIDGQTPDEGARREGLPSIPPMADLEPQRHNTRRDTRGGGLTAPVNLTRKVLTGKDGGLILKLWKTARRSKMN